MTTTLPPKLLRFAKLLARDHDQTTAWERSGHKRDTGHASRAANRPDVRAWLQEYRLRAERRSPTPPPPDVQPLLDAPETDLPLHLQAALVAFKDAQAAGDRRGMIAAAALMKPPGRPGRRTREEVAAAEREQQEPSARRTAPAGDATAPPWGDPADPEPPGAPQPLLHHNGNTWCPDFDAGGNWLFTKATPAWLAWRAREDKRQADEGAWLEEIKAAFETPEQTADRHERKAVNAKLEQEQQARFEESQRRERVAAFPFKDEVGAFDKACAVLNGFPLSSGRGTHLELKRDLAMQQQRGG